MTRLYPDPRLPPSTLHLPSLSSPTGQDRDFDPALVVAFNRSAKLLTASDASRSGNKRLLAIGGEEGAIKIIDVDALEPHDSKWWSAHQNGIFDISWCDDDRHLVSETTGTASDDSFQHLLISHCACMMFLEQVRGFWPPFTGTPQPSSLRLFCTSLLQMLSFLVVGMATSMCMICAVGATRQPAKRMAHLSAARPAQDPPRR